MALALSCVAMGIAGTAAPAGAAGPACTFNNSSTPIVTDVSAGSKVAIKCTGLPALHPYLVLQASLLIGIDPKAAALLSGGSLGLGTLEAALAALPEIDAASITPLLSDLSGSLNFTYTVPTFQPTDPNASCPPSTAEINAGLIGCALAMVDVTTQKPVAAGSGILEYAGDPFLPPNPTLAFSAKKATPGQQVTVSDKHGATTYWWLATLASLEALLGGGAAPTPVISVDFIGKHGVQVAATNNVTVSPASYDGTTLTPPILSGTFTVPAGVTGLQKVLVQYAADLSGINTAVGVEHPLKV
ncbi:MAG TPA: hypothetical protein VN796_01635 [Acidimicrobiales bacterium]|nr:hypothetical protein [Acidimicrobiales bacterium]